MDASQNPIDYKEFADKQDPGKKVIYGGYGYVDGKLYNVFRYPLKDDAGYSEPVLMPAPLGTQEHIGYKKNDYNEAMLMSQVNLLHESTAGGTVTSPFGIRGTFGKGENAVEVEPLEIKITTSEDEGRIANEQYRMFLPDGSYIGFRDVAELKNYYYKMVEETLKQ